MNFHNIAQTKLLARSFSISFPCLFIFLLQVTMSCLSVNTLNQSLEEPQIDIGLHEPLEKPFAGLSLPNGIKIDTVLSPVGLAPQSFSYKSGVIIIPLLIYNRFQSNYLITLGAKQFQQPLSEAFHQRFQTMLTSCEDSTRSLDRGRYTLGIDLNSCLAQGIYVNGFWTGFYGYSAITQNIDHGRNAFSFVRIRWELSDGEETVATGNVLVTLKDSYYGSINGFITSNGRRRELVKSDLNYGIPFQADYGMSQNLNAKHMNQILEVVCLSLDEASEEVLRDISRYFQGRDLTGNK